MRAKKADVKRADILGEAAAPAKRENFFAALLKPYWHRLGCYSLFAATPVMLTSHLQEVRANETKVEEPSIAERPSRPAGRLNTNRRVPVWLRRQSGFRLPHQKGFFEVLNALGGGDDCPGRRIPGGVYTAAAPYTDSGDTTGSNNTVKRVYFYHGYYYFNSIGPDHVYSFMLSGRGPNPQIQISTTSPAYRPLVYMLGSRSSPLPCPTGTENEVSNYLTEPNSTTGGVATFDSQRINSLPLHVPLYLFIDSNSNGPDGAGPYTVRMQDVTLPSLPCDNLIDCTESFVRQHYFDFLSRDPDPAGLAFWTADIDSCGADAQCREIKRINVSAAFFLSIEFHETGYLTHRAFKVAYGNLPGKPVPLTLGNYLVGAGIMGQGVQVGVGDWQQHLETNKTVYFNNFVMTSEFTTAYPPGMDNGAFVDALNQNAGGALSGAERDALVAALNTGMTTRAQALRRVAEHPTFAQGPEKNRAFVLAQYFGYLRRNPDDPGLDGQPDPNFDGYHFWLDKLEQFGGNFVAAEMVKAFITSIEYRRRFGQP